MTEQYSNLHFVHIYYRKTSRGDLEAFFVIDGRDYQDVDEMKKAIVEATIRTYQLGLVYETEARLVRNPKEPRLKLPSWEAFKKQAVIDQIDLTRLFQVIEKP